LFRNFLFFAFPFVTCGYLIAKTQSFERLNRNLLVTLAILGLSLVVCESTVNFTALEQPGSFELLVSLALVCPAVFLLALSSPLPGSSKWIAQIAIAIYLVHPAFILLAHNQWGMRGTQTAMFALLASFLTAPAIIAANKKIRVLL